MFGWLRVHFSVSVNSDLDKFLLFIRLYTSHRHTSLRHQDPGGWIHVFSHSVFEIGEVPLIQKVYSLPRRSRPRGGRSAPVSRSRDSFRKLRKVAFAVHARSRPPSQSTQLHHFSLTMSRSLGRSFRTGVTKSSRGLFQGRQGIGQSGPRIAGHDRAPPGTTGHHRAPPGTTGHPRANRANRANRAPPGLIAGHNR